MFQMPTPAHHIKQYNGSTNLAMPFIKNAISKLQLPNGDKPAFYILLLIKIFSKRFGIQKFNAKYVSCGHLKIK